ncbi:MAG: helix-hairpin-helix domain-containing protein [Nitrospira sp.]
MNVLQSFLLKLAMFAMTLGVVGWIGWTLPQDMHGPSPHAVSLSSAEVPTGSMELVRSTDRIVTRPAETAAIGEARLDLNRATVAEFERLPGVGPVLARRMAAYRTSVGRFQTVEDLRSVKGLGRKKLDRLKPLVTVGPSQDREQRGQI